MTSYLDGISYGQMERWLQLGRATRRMYMRNLDHHLQSNAFPCAVFAEDKEGSAFIICSGSVLGWS